MIDDFYLGEMESEATVKSICRDIMPALRDSFGGKQIPESLTEFQDLIRKDPLTAHMLLKPVDVLRDTLMSAHLYTRWDQCGRPVFRLTENLMASLLLTDPKDVEPELIRPPFRTFGLEIPDSFWETLNYKDDMVPIRTVWVHNSTSLKVDLDEVVVELEAARKAPHIRLITFMLCGRGVSLHDSLEQHPLDDMSVSEWLTQDTGTKNMVLNLPQSEQDFHVRLAMRRLYVNLCLYVGERGRGRRLNPGLAQKQAKRRRKKGKPKVEKIKGDTWILGKEIVLDKELVESAKDWVRHKGGQRNRWKIRKRSVTIGHWRSQAHGPARSLRKRIWIEPYWRGPREGAKIQHVYTTQTGRIQCAKPNKANGPKEAK